MGGSKKQTANAALAIKIDGTAMDAKEVNRLLEVSVDQSLHMPSMCVIHLVDNFDNKTDKLQWADAPAFALGKALKVEIIAATQGGRDGEDGNIFDGEITALEPEFAEDRSTTMIVRGYDKSHRMNRGQKTRTFLKKTDSAIAKELASPAGLTFKEAPAATTQHEYVLQHNLTDFEFLQQRAQRLGYSVYTELDKLHFKQGFTGATTLADKLKWGKDLLSFRPRITGVQQADKATVYGWDSKEQKAIKGEKTKVTSRDYLGGQKNSGGVVAKSAFGNASAAAVVLDRPVETPDEANALAQSLLDEINTEFVQAEGVAWGDPRIAPGVVIEIEGLGRRFSGKYYVTQATHVYRRGDYRTHFTITGRMPYTISNLVGGSSIADKGKIYGVVVGTVTNLQDPDKLGRVKVEFGWMMDNTASSPKPIESTWARLASPMAGPEIGLLWMPEIKDEVLVAFDHGDVNYPYVLGSIWSSKNKPPAAKSGDIVGSDKKVDHHLFKSRSGHIIDLVDKQNEEQINLLSKSGHTIVLDDKNGKEQIMIKDKTGNNSIVIDSAKNSITILCDKDLSIEAKGNISMKTASGDVSIEGKNVKIKASMQGSFEGTSGLSLKGAPPATIEMKGKVDVNNGALEVM